MMPNIRNSPAADISREFQTGLPPDVRNRPYINYQTLDLSSSSEVLPGEREVINVYPPEGFIYKSKALHLFIPPPADATIGTHYFFLSIAGGIDIMSIESNFGDSLYYAKCEVIEATKNIEPHDATVQGLIPEKLFASEDNPLVISYQNDTDVSQNHTKIIRLLVEGVKV